MGESLEDLPVVQVGHEVVALAGVQRGVGEAI
jgi:hypothetical protein